MKKLGLLLLTLTLLLSLCGCTYRLCGYTYQDPVLASLPDCKSKVFYTSGGFQDFTDYAKYTYESVTAQDLKESKFFSETTADDVEEILLHIDNFEEWVETIGEELKDNYDFDKNIVSEGDFFYIETKAGEPIGQGTYDKFDNYSVYYFDIDTQTLYYFHNNI
ncbi:MAG: hypothetical protein IJB27_04205 [Clostridia bacterium]|nr:hypothetical protein [Clostridia bacterium]